MKYIRKAIEVEAIQIHESFQIGSLRGKAGDWLINGDSVMTDDEFQRDYMPLPSFAPVDRVTPAIQSVVRSTPIVQPISQEDFEHTENQASMMICMTCGCDVQVSKVDAERNCPACHVDHVPAPAPAPKKKNKLHAILLERALGAPVVEEEDDASV